MITSTTISYSHHRTLARVIAVLDWEMATVGDPLMDLGTTLGYWVESTDSEEWQRSGFVLTRLPGNLSRKEVVDYYAEKKWSSNRRCHFLLRLRLIEDRRDRTTDLFSI